MAQKEKRRKFSFLITVLAGAPVSLLFKQLKNHSLDLKFAGRVIGTVIVGCILEPFRWWEILRWKRKLKRTATTRPPVFIIGFWRSGTTMLHSLLCQAPGTAYITTYQTVFPDLLLSHSWWFKPIIGKFWPTHRPFDDVKMGLDLPQEEEIALANLQEISFYNFLYFPKDFEKFYSRELFIRDLPAEMKATWMREYKRMIAKSVLNTGGNRFISKSPSNMARIGLILEMFPDARFIFLYRDPYKSVESFYRFFQEVIPAVQIQENSDLLNRSRVTKIYADMIRQYQVEKSKISPENLMEIRFEDFRKDPIGGVRAIYDQFGMEGYEEAVPYFKAYLEDVAEFRQKQYEITGETISNLNANATDIVDWLGYPKRTS